MRMLESHVRTLRCAQCFGPVVQLWFDEPDETGDHWRVVCPKECQPGGWISEQSAEYRKAKDLYDANRVGVSYPELDDRPKLSAEEEQKNRKALWD